jgi:hypothetical protein
LGIVECNYKQSLIKALMYQKLEKLLLINNKSVEEAARAASFFLPKNNERGAMILRNKPMFLFFKRTIITGAMLFFPAYCTPQESPVISRLHRLPDELLVEIFKQGIKQSIDLTELEAFPQLGGTCRLFERLLNDKEIQEQWIQTHQEYAMREELVRKLNKLDKIDAKIPLNKSLPLVHTAAKHNLYEWVQRQLSKDPQLAYSSDYFNKTPLHIAAAHGHLEMVKLLLAYNAHLKGRNSDQPNPVVHAWQNSHFDVVKLLLARGALIDPHQCNIYQILDQEICVN